MKKNRYNILKNCIAISAILQCFSLSAKELSIGLGTAWSSSLYRGVKNNILPFPDVEYDNDSYYIRGLGAGYYLYNEKSDKLSIAGYYSPLSFSPSDSSDARLKKLKKRHSTLMAGLDYEHDFGKFGTFRTQVSGDTLGVNNGITIDSSWGYHIPLGDFDIVPALGVNWSSKNYNNYYFGVTKKESNRSGLSTYSAGSSLSPFVELNAQYALSDRLHVGTGVRYERFSSEIYNSPMVDKKNNISVMTNISYSF